MIYHVSSSLELRIASNNINGETCNEIKCIDTMVECYYATLVLNIMIICEYPNKLLCEILFDVWRWPIM